MSVQVLTVIFCLAIPVWLQAQSTVDSLKSRIEVSLRSDDFSALSTDYAYLGYHYYNEHRYDSSLFYYKKSLDYERVAPNANLLASNLNALGSAYSYLGKSDSSILYYQRAATVYTTLSDIKNLAGVETNLSILFKNLALYDKSLEYAFRAMSKQEELGEWKALSSSSANVGLVYLKVKDYGSALKYAYQALSIRKKINYVKGVALSYNNIGDIYLTMQNYDSALVNLERSLKIKKAIKDEKTFSTTLMNLGTAYYHLGDMSEAEHHFTEAWRYNKRFKNQVNEAACYNALARIALFNRNTEKAAHLLSQAESILQTTSAPEVLKENLEIKIEHAELSRQHPRAVSYMRQLIAVKDTILNREKAESMNSLNIRYETEKKEQQILLLQEQGQLKSVEIKAKQSMIYGLTAGVILLVVIVTLIFNNFKIARKGKMMQELFNRELNHRVKNNLQLLASVLSLQSQELTDETAVTAVKRNESRVNAMALIHRKLYLGENTRTVNMKDYVRELLDFLLYSSSYSKDEISINTEVEEMELDVDKAIPLGLIINELISNSLKYAFHSEKDPVINVTLNTVKGKDLSLSVLDNGSGFVPSAVLPEEQSFGLKMIHLLTKELRGSIRIESEGGTCAYIKIPLK